ncbi:MAG: hypothetical protein AB1810_11790 [Pseudomonadota bacterium]
MRIFGAIAALAALVAVYFLIFLNWNYSVGERAGWVQKISHKGWICKTWEGELSMVAMPGSMPEKFYFTVRDDEVAESINRSIGKRVALHYEQKVGLPTSCFGETRYYVTKVTLVDEPQPAPGAVAPAPAATATPAPAMHN